jgi:hypothetical protein
VDTAYNQWLKAVREGRSVVKKLKTVSDAKKRGVKTTKTGRGAKSLVRLRVKKKNMAEQKKIR